VRPTSVESSFLAVWIEYIPILGYTEGLQRRHVRPSREHPRRAKRHGQRRCGVVRSSRSDRARAPEALPQRIQTNPNLAAAERTRHASRPHDSPLARTNPGRPKALKETRSIRTNPTRAEAPMTTCARTNPAAAQSERTRCASWPRDPRARTNPKGTAGLADPTGTHEWTQPAIQTNPTAAGILEHRGCRTKRTRAGGGRGSRGVALRPWPGRSLPVAA
jgi:hypothetical protein